MGEFFPSYLKGHMQSKLVLLWNEMVILEVASACNLLLLHNSYFYKTCQVINPHLHSYPLFLNLKKHLDLNSS